jgi:hypothetical protein
VANLVKLCGIGDGPAFADIMRRTLTADRVTHSLMILAVGATPRGCYMPAWIKVRMDVDRCARKRKRPSVKYVEQGNV